MVRQDVEQSALSRGCLRQDDTTGQKTSGALRGSVTFLQHTDEPRLVYRNVLSWYVEGFLCKVPVHLMPLREHCLNLCPFLYAYSAGFEGLFAHICISRRPAMEQGFAAWNSL